MLSWGSKPCNRYLVQTLWFIAITKGSIISLGWSCLQRFTQCRAHYSYLLGQMAVTHCTKEPHSAVWSEAFPIANVRNLLMQSEIPSGICAKLRTVAASINRVHMPWSLFAYAIATFNRWHRYYHQRLHATITLLLLVHATYMYGVFLHAHPVGGE